MAPTGAPPVVSEESLDVAWWPVDALPADTEPAVADLVATAVSLVTPRRA